VACNFQGKKNLFSETSPQKFCGTDSFRHVLQIFLNSAGSGWASALPSSAAGLRSREFSHNGNNNIHS
jgi:hypothetical protein